MEETLAFSMYLHYVELRVSQESTQEQYLEDYDEKEKELAIEHSEEPQDEEQCINPEEEKKMSNNGEAILLFFKCMSEALGGHSLAWSVDKVILIEKRSAFHIFCYYFRKMCSRARYFLSYTTYVLAASVKDPLMLEPYGKHKLI